MWASRADNASGGSGGRRRVRRPGVAMLLLLTTAVASGPLALAGCAGRGLRVGPSGRFHHDDPIYSIEAPRFSGDVEWRRVSVDGTDLAWRTGDGRSMSLSSSCRPTRARPALLARRLLIGVPRDDLVAAHPVALLGDPGWAQVVETGEGAEAIRIKTVTVVSVGCVFDWVLVASAGPRFDESLEAFDAWWASFERPHPDDAPAREEPAPGDAAAVEGDAS